MKIQYTKEEYLQKRRELIQLSLKINHLLDDLVIPEDVSYQKFVKDLEELANQLVGLWYWFKHEPFRGDVNETITETT